MTSRYVTVHGGYYSPILDLWAVTLDPGSTLAVKFQVDATNGTHTVAVYGAAGGPSTVINSGVIRHFEAFGYYGIQLKGGGSVDNVYHIFGGVAIDIDLSQTGHVSNHSLDAAYPAVIRGNTFGIRLGDGTITNGAHSIIQGQQAIASKVFHYTTIDNSGTISGDMSASQGRGIELYGGSVTNELGGEISGNYGVAMLNSLDNLYNSGLIRGNQAGIKGFGGAITNESSGTIAGTTTGIYLSHNPVINAGQITAGGTGIFILGNNTQITNTASGIIAGGTFGIDVGSSGATIRNAGQISGGTTAIRFGSSGRLIVEPGATFIGLVDGNNGGSQIELASGSSAGTASGFGSQYTRFSGVTIDASATWTIASGSVRSGYAFTVAGSLINQVAIASGVTLAAGAALTNASGASVSVSSGNAITASGSAALANAGLVSAASYAALFSAGGSITNASGATMASTGGIRFTGGAGQLSNAGTISGSTHAVQFAAGDTNTLTMLPQAVFSGTVDGGNAVGATAVSTLVLGSGTAPGTLASFGSQFVDFAAIDVASAASWALHAGSIGSGYTINVEDSGSLTASGTFASGITLGSNTNFALSSSGTITVGSGAAVSASGVATLLNVGHITGSSAGITLAAGGTVTSQTQAVITGATGIDSNGASRLINFGSIAAQTGISVIGGGYVYNGEPAHLSATSLGIYARMGDVTVKNSGVLHGANGIELLSGGTVTNATYAGITASASFGIYVTSSLFYSNGIAVTNFGTIAGGALTTGIKLGLGGNITNGGQGIISSGTGIMMTGNPGAVLNQGSINGTNGAGVSSNVGGVVTNAAGGTITGSVGVRLTGFTSTLTNGGQIGGATYAVQFSTGSTNRLVVDPGASFTGTVDGGNTIGSAQVSNLELASGASAGTLSAFGTQFVNFSDVTVAANARWVVTGSNNIAAGGSLTNQGTLTLLNAQASVGGDLVNNGVIVIDPSSVTSSGLTGTGQVTIADGSTLTVTGTVAAGETITLGSGRAVLDIQPELFSGQILGFAFDDTIDLAGVTDAVFAHIVNTNTLEVVRDTHSALELTLDTGRDFTGAHFFLTPDGSDTLLTTDLACFAAGTRIDTPDGSTAVEALHVGNMVLTETGPQPVRWIGWRRLDLTRHRDPALAQPIRIAAGAFGAHLPRRDLLVSPDHALLVDGMLIPARLLVNHRSIRHERNCRSVTYFHIELDRHAILLAEGLPAESYLDTGNRAMFENAGAVVTLHPDLSGQAGRRARSCAPFADRPERVKPAWDRLATQADVLGYPPHVAAMTPDPGLRLRVGDRLLRPARARDGWFAFALPDGGAPRLVSRAARPSDARPWVEDRRLLGVAVRRLRLWREEIVAEVPLDHPDLVQGWWAWEGAAGVGWRWTNGDATLPACCNGPAVLQVQVVGTLDYPAETRRDPVGDSSVAA